MGKLSFSFPFHASNLLLLPIISRLFYNFACIVPSLELYGLSFHLTVLMGNNPADQERDNM
ncbi:hypothetical protein QOT17_002526 [Balamuthia mandrillaris]